MRMTELSEMATLLGVDEVRIVCSTKNNTTLTLRVREWWSKVSISTAVLEDDATQKSGMLLWDEIQTVCRVLRDRADIAEWLCPRESRWSPYP